MGPTSRILSVSATLLLMVAGSGCQQLAANVPKAVLLEYDQVLNFLDYQLQDTVEFTNSQDGKSAFVSGLISARNHGHPDGFINGVFLTFVICKVANTASQAEPFQYDVTKFYVVHAGKRYYAQALEPYTLLYFDGGSVQEATPGIIDGIQEALRDETQVGADQESISVNQEVYPYFRFTIYVYASGPFDAKLQPRLMYDSAHPHVMSPRNQPPAVEGGALFTPNDADIGKVPTKCRPPAG
jgi:hypothetical protein